MVSEQSPYATQLKKCDTLLISKSSFIGPMVPVLIGDSLIGWVSKLRLLGTIADDRLSWSPQMIDLKKRFPSKLSLLKRRKAVLSKTV